MEAKNKIGQTKKKSYNGERRRRGRKVSDTSKIRKYYIYLVKHKHIKFCCLFVFKSKAKHY